jgi:hypothetical protein
MTAGRAAPKARSASLSEGDDKAPPSKLGCPKCEREFKGPEGLRAHLVIEHGMTQKEARSVRPRVAEDYQNGSGRMQSSGGSSAAPTPAPGAAPKPAAPGAKPTAPAAPAKRLSSPDLDKASQIADKISSTPGLDRPDVLANKLKQTIGSGGNPQQAATMDALVRAQLANRGVAVEEGLDDFVTEKSFMDVVRTVTGQKAAPKAAPVLTAPQQSIAPAKPAAKLAPVLTRTTQVPFATTMGRPEIQAAFGRMTEALGLPAKMASAIDRSMAKQGSWTGFVDGRYARFPEATWARIRQRLQPHFTVTVSGQDDHCKLTITLAH